MSFFRSPLGLLGPLCVLLLFPSASPAQSVFSPCLTNASNNATVVLPPSVSGAIGPSNAPLDGGSSPDSIAVVDADGTCLSVSAWSDSEGATLSVAGDGPLVSGGLSDADSLEFRVYDASRDAVDRVLVEYTPCASVSPSLQPLCRDNGRYEKDVIYESSAIGSYALALQIEGTPGADAADAGWRFVGPPTASEVPAEDLRLGGEAPDFSLPGDGMVVRWNDAAAAESGPTGAYEGLSATDPLQPGRGYALYLFHQPPYALEPSITIDMAGSPGVRNTDPVTVDNLTQTARWHLLANPYPSGYDLSALSDLSANGFQSTVQRYDATTGSWVVETQSNTDLADWQAFFIERTDVSGNAGATDLTFSSTGRIVDAPFIGSEPQNAAPPQQRATLGLSLRVTSAAGDTVSYDRAARVVFDDKAATGWDTFDATKLTPLNATYALLAPQGRGRSDSLVDKSVESRPWPSTRQSVPVRVRTENIDAGTAALASSRWTLPETWSAQLIDEHEGTTHPLDSTTTISVPLHVDTTRDDPRFTLQVAPSGAELPLELVGLDATLQNDAVQLRWQVKDVVNETGFYVDRRTVTDTTGSASPGPWTEVGRVAVTGTSPQTTYRFQDADLPYEAVQYVYRLRQVEADGTVHRSDPVRIDRSAVQKPTLKRSFPNPASTQATIRYAVPRAQHVRIDLYDLLGRRVRVLTDERKRAGRHQLTLDTSDLPSGTYFYRLDAADVTSTRKVTVLR